MKALRALFANCTPRPQMTFPTALPIDGETVSHRSEWGRAGQAKKNLQGRSTPMPNGLN